MLAQAAALAPRLAALPLVDHTINVLSLVPADQPPKLAALADAAEVLGPALQPPPPAPAPDAAALRTAAAAAASQLGPVMGKLPAASPMHAILRDLQALRRLPIAPCSPPMRR